MPLRVGATMRDAMVAGGIAAVDAGSYVKIYTGAQPSATTVSPTGTLLATFNLGSPAFNDPVAGSPATLITGAGIDATAVGSGTAGWGRVFDSSDAVLFDGVASNTVGQFVLDVTTVTTGDPMTLVSGTLGVASGE